MTTKKKTQKAEVVPMTFDSQPTPVGVDASWTGLAVTALEPAGTAMVNDKVLKGWAVRMSEVLSTKPGDFPSQSARLLELGELFRAAVNAARILKVEQADRVYGPCIVAIEGYAMGSKTRPQMAGELGGHLRLLLWQTGIPYIIVPPNSLKSYVTGKGTSPKEVMMMTAYKRWGYEAPDNDQCDAYCLARVAAEFAAGGWTKKFEGLAQGFEVVGVKGGGS